MSFKLALVAVVHRTSAADDGKPSLVLLQGANAWLQRLAAGIQDDLFLIGVGFEDAPAFQAMLRPYGLANATIDVVPPEAEEDGDLDSDDWRESVAARVEAGGLVVVPEKASPHFSHLLRKLVQRFATSARREDEEW